jgi:hypothetical protein
MQVSDLQGYNISNVQIAQVASRILVLEIKDAWISYMGG